MVYILTKKDSPLALFSGSKVKEQLNFEVSIRFKISSNTLTLGETSSAHHIGVNRVLKDVLKLAFYGVILGFCGDVKKKSSSKCRLLVLSAKTD